jgi:hypothetical protein
MGKRPSGHAGGNGKRECRSNSVDPVHLAGHLESRQQGKALVAGLQMHLGVFESVKSVARVNAKGRLGQAGSPPDVEIADPGLLKNPPGSGCGPLRRSVGGTTDCLEGPWGRKDDFFNSPMHRVCLSCSSCPSLLISRPPLGRSLAWANRRKDSPPTSRPSYLLPWPFFVAFHARVLKCERAQ